MAGLPCKQIEPDLSAWIDGELPPERIREVELHTRECGACRAALDDLRRVSRGVAELPRLAAPAGLAAAMREAAEKRISNAPAAGAELPRILRWAPLLRRISASAALFMLCVFVGWKLLLTQGRVGEETLLTKKSADMHQRIEEKQNGGFAMGLVDKRTTAKPSEPPGSAVPNSSLLESAPTTDAGIALAMKQQPIAQSYANKRESDEGRRGAPAVAAPPSAAPTEAPSLRTMSPPVSSPAPSTPELAAQALESAPIVDVVVMPRTLDEYEAVSRYVSELTQTTVVADGGGADRQVSSGGAAAGYRGIDRDAAVNAERSVLLPQQAVVHVVQGRIRPVIDELEQAAPTRVNVTLNVQWSDREKFQDLLAPAKEEAAKPPAYAKRIAPAGVNMPMPSSARAGGEERKNDEAENLTDAEAGRAAAVANHVGKDHAEARDEAGTPAAAAKPRDGSTEAGRPARRAETEKAKTANDEIGSTGAARGRKGPGGPAGDGKVGSAPPPGSKREQRSRGDEGVAGNETAIGGAAPKSPASTPTQSTTEVPAAALPTGAPAGGAAAAAEPTPVTAFAREGGLAGDALVNIKYFLKEQSEALLQSLLGRYVREGMPLTAPVPQPDERPITLRVTLLAPMDRTPATAPSTRP